MGAKACCAQKRQDVGIETIGDSPIPSRGHGAVFLDPALFLPAAPLGLAHARACVDDDFVSEVARQLASDRCQQLYQAAALIPVVYDVRAADLEEPQHTATAVHRKTQVTRQLATFQKPLNAGAQERMHTYVSSLQRVSARSESIARVFEVYEDYVNVHMVLEHCSGGSVYDRILERQYFTEQESAMIVFHMLEAVATLHEERVYHGCLTPDAFRFLNNSPHAPLKLVDFGVELKVHRWNSAENLGDGPDLPTPQFMQFFETCKLVFCAPEMAPPHEPVKRRRRSPGCPSGRVPLLEAEEQNQTHAEPGYLCAAGNHAASEEGSAQDILDGDLLADVIDEHSDWILDRLGEDGAVDYHRKFEAADVWSVGAIAFLLLCGYPPFFAPTSNAVLGRIHRGEISFDPPFWSKISEEAKSFVNSCLKMDFCDRSTVQSALQHPWIQRLAEGSPSGSMFQSFMFNLRRFYRTSRIELYVANILATKFRREDMHDFLRRCQEIDLCSTGFFTASDLKHVLVALGHEPVAEAITARFLRVFRHPGESYIDYVSLLDSIYLRRRRLFDAELWRHFQRVCCTSGHGGEAIGCLSIGELGMLFSDPVVANLLMRELPESAGAEEATVCRRLQSSVRQHCSDHGTAQINFHELASLLPRFVRLYLATASAHGSIAASGGANGSSQPMKQPAAADDEAATVSGPLVTI